MYLNSGIPEILKQDSYRQGHLTLALWVIFHVYEYDMVFQDHYQSVKI